MELKLIQQARDGVHLAVNDAGQDCRQGRASSGAAPGAEGSARDRQQLLAALRASIAAMSPEEQRELARSLCSVVDGLSRAILDNADALWAARGAQ